MALQSRMQSYQMTELGSPALFPWIIALLHEMEGRMRKFPIQFTLFKEIPLSEHTKSNFSSHTAYCNPVLKKC